MILNLSRTLNAVGSPHVHSESGETPIMMAIQNMNPFEQNTPLDDRCFKLLAKHGHTKKTVNRRSTKLTPSPEVLRRYSSSL